MHSISSTFPPYWISFKMLCNAVVLHFAPSRNTAFYMHLGTACTTVSLLSVSWCSRYHHLSVVSHLQAPQLIGQYCSEWHYMNQIMQISLFMFFNKQTTPYLYISLRFEIRKYLVFDLMWKFCYSNVKWPCTRFGHCKKHVRHVD